MEGVGSSGHEPYLTPAGLRISSVRQVKIPVLVGRHEIFTNFGGGDTKSPPVLVGEARKSPPVLVGNARNFHQPWRSPQKNKPPGYRHRDMTSAQSCAALKSPFPQAIIKCVIVFLQPAAFRDKQAACQTTGGRR